jgi:hypothetical protein
MDNDDNRSSIKLISNIMLKSKFEKDSWGYLPPDLLPPYYSDTRVRSSLTKRQQEQFDKRLFYASRIVDE